MADWPALMTLLTSSSVWLREAGSTRPSSMSFRMNVSAAKPPPWLNRALPLASTKSELPNAADNWVQSQMTASACFQLAVIGYLTPVALISLASASTSSHVLGADVMPAFANMSVL